MTTATAIDLVRPNTMPVLPEVIYVETSNSCNSLCQTCPLTFFGNGAPRNLTLAELESIVDQLPGLKRVVLHGIGEPLLNRELALMIRFLKARSIHTLFNSNIIALTRRRQAELVESGLDELRVSLDGATEETYRRVRGVPAFAKVVKHLREIVEARELMAGTSPRISVWFTAMRENLVELADVARIAAESGADEFYVQRLVYAGYGLAREEQSICVELRRSEIKQIREAEAICREYGMGFRASGDTVAIETLEGPGAQRDLGDVRASERPWMACHRPWYLTYITAHGDVLPCCFIPFISASAKPAHVLGNVFRQPIADIWNGPAYRDFRFRFLSSTPYDCCAGCGSKWSV
ncbi:MAG: radical SAM protein [Chloroflexota bacterium]|nr:radical SAM protein [Chloroflexota bacterium]